MAISGTTNTCQIMTNTQFVLSGISQTNLSTINVTDENGLDVSECFGIETNIITVVADNVVLTGNCDTSLEIIITEGVSKPVECNFIDFTEDQDTNLIIFEFQDGSTSFNTHPDCCTSLGFTPEIGIQNFYVCRWRDEIDSTDCDNYVTTGTFDSNDYMIFDYAAGNTTTIVPSVQCCYAVGLVENIVNGNIHCIEEVIFDPCEGLEVIEPAPDFGVIDFLNPDTNFIVTTVNSSECCTLNGFSYQAVNGGFECYNSLTIEKPTVTITNDPCCEEDEIIIPPTCTTWRFNPSNNLPSGEGIEIQYINCNGDTVQDEFYSSSSINFICAREMLFIDLGNTQINGSPYIPAGNYSGQWGSGSGGTSTCS